MTGQDRPAVPTADRPWLDTGLPVADRVDALMGRMTLEENVGQTHQVANIHPDDDAEALRRASICSSVLPSGAMGGNERDEGVLAFNIVKRGSVSCVGRTAAGGRSLGDYVAVVCAPTRRLHRGQARARRHTETLRLELVDQPVRVTEIAPGMVRREGFALTRFGGDEERAYDACRHRSGVRLFAAS